MAIKLFEVLGEVVIDGKKADKSLDSMDKKGKGVASRLGSMVGKAAKFTAAAGVMGIAAVTALGKIATSAAGTLDRIDKLSQRLGLSRDAFQTWEFVLSQSGSTMEDLQSGMKGMVQRIDELKNGVGEGAEAFEKLGLTWEDLEGLNQEEAFDKIVLAFNNMEDGLDKANIAQEIFSRSGQNLLPLLNQNAQAVSDMKDEAHDLGLVLGDEAIDAGVKFTDTWDAMKRSMKAVTTGLGAAVIPMFQKLAEWVIKNMPMIQEKFRIAMSRIKDVLFIVWDFIQDNIIPVIERFRKVINEIMPDAQGLFNTVFTKIFEVLFSVWDFIKIHVIPIVKKMYGFFLEWLPEIKAIAVEVFESIVEKLTVLWEFVKEFIIPIWLELFNWFVDNMPKFKEIGLAVFNAIRMVVERLWDVFEKFLLPVLRTVYGWIKKHMPEIKVFMTAALDVIIFAVDLVTAAIGFFFDILEKVLNFVGGAFSFIGRNFKKAFEGVTDFIQGIVDKIQKAIDVIQKITGAIKKFFSSAADEEDKYISNSTLGSGNFGDLADQYGGTNDSTPPTAGYGSTFGGTNINIYNNNNPDADDITRQIQTQDDIKALNY